MQAGQPSADPLGQQSGDGRLLAGGDQSRRGRRQHDADAARRRAHARSSTRPRSALALCDTRLMDELVACAKDEPLPQKVIGFDGTANHDAELDRIALDKSVRYEAVRTGRDDVALLGFTSGTTGAAEGDDALPSRSAHHRRRLRQGGARGHARRRVRRLAAACFHLRPRWSGGLPTAVRRRRNAARERVAAEHGRDHRDVQGDGVLHRADRLSRDARGDRRTAPICLRCAWRFPPARRCPLPCTKPGWRKTGKPMLDGIGATEMLHIFISNRLDDSKPACTGTPVHGYEARIVDDDMNDVPREHRRPARGSRSHRLPLPRRRPSAHVRSGRLEPDRRFVRPGRRRLLPFRRPLRRHDHLVRLQHRRARGGGRAAVAPRTSSSAR